jgi:glutamine---fructose-6-phosphate transaminase (isomerizing)
MCGIVGILSNKPVASELIDALRRLEYRGYDSAGIATVENGHIERRRAEGKLCNLEARVAAMPLSGVAGIGHTRWATHGKPIERNAHPHMSDRVSVVHNGIIENYQALKAELSAKGHRFETDTDTEAVVHLITEELRQGCTPVQAVRAALKRLQGAYALGIVFSGHDDLMIAARRGSPLVIGHGRGTMYIGSDAMALAPFTNSIAYLEEGDWAVITRACATVFDRADRQVERPFVELSATHLAVDKGKHSHFMAKEIREQPDVIARTLAGFLDVEAKSVVLPDLGLDFTSIERVTVSACGTAYYAGLVGKYWIERYARIPVEVDIASELRYRNTPLPAGGLTILVSQSGETADTLAALRYAKANGQRIASIVNVPNSSISRESHVVLPTLAGPEIGVASTKAFTCQLCAFACLAIALGRAHGTLTRALERELVRVLLEVPRHAASTLRLDPQIMDLAIKLSRARNALYLGRGISYPIAMEGALKLKEISYIHAEGYAAGEMKHGPIALIDKQLPVVVVAPKDDLFEKTVSNMQEVVARSGQIILISNASTEEVGCELAGYVRMPDIHPFVTPLIYALPMQLLAYHTAVQLGTDVDKPRNLAKSVTVE